MGVLQKFLSQPGSVVPQDITGSIHACAQVITELYGFEFYAVAEKDVYIRTADGAAIIRQIAGSALKIIYAQHDEEAFFSFVVDKDVIVELAERISAAPDKAVDVLTIFQPEVVI